MKEATGEVSGVVVTIVIIGLVLAVATTLFTVKGDNGRSIVENWIVNIFENKVDCANGKC